MKKSLRISFALCTALLAFLLFEGGARLIYFVEDKGFSDFRTTHRIPRKPAPRLDAYEMPVTEHPGH